MEKKMNKLFFVSSCYSYFVNGMLVLMTGAILTYLMKDYGLSYYQGGLLVSIQATGSLLSGLLSGVIIHFLGKRKTMLFASLMFIIGFGGIIFTSQPVILFFLIFLTGIGWGLNNNLLNILVGESDNENGSYTNILHMGYAIGAFVSPLMLSAFVNWGISWKIAVAIISAAAGLLFIVFTKVPFGAETQKVKTKEKLSFEFLKDPRYFVYMMILFTYVGAEIGLNAWLVTYLVEKGIMDVAKAQLMLSLLWVVIIFGRMFTAFISKYIPKDIILLGQCGSMLLFYGLFLINKNPLIAVAVIVAIGISMAGIYPTTVANANHIVTGTSLGSGIMFAGGSLGATVVPYIAGAIAESNGIGAGMLSNFVIVVIMAILAVVNRILTKKHTQILKGV